MRLLCKPPPKKNFIKIQRMLKKQTNNNLNAFSMNTEQSQISNETLSFFERDDQQRMLDMLNKTYTSQKIDA